ncbi:response regulator [Ruficoccus amylovorans]|uniref:Response regulator n=1 Tax=Ruficoccus amylovorans TaxID=1804625 RepID=A0A842HE10_9BACT|nr:response regulator [Ruficoccus amylovorans]MBC2594672.1 response regulator [Ruficoccus amylovorans]
MPITKVRKILLVEDNPDDEALTLRALSKCGVANEVDVVHNGQDAVNYLRAQGKFRDRDPDDLPQLVLLDLKLPMLDGLEVLEIIRSDEATRTLPVVIFTSSKEKSDLTKGYQLGVNSFVCKPINFAEFSESIRQLGLYWLLVNEPPPKLS